MNTVREVMAVRYRELYGTTLGDPNSVVRATLGRGVVMYFWNLPASAPSAAARLCRRIHSQERRPHQLHRSHRPLRMDRSRFQHFLHLPPRRNRVDLRAGAALPARVHRRDDDLRLSLPDRPEQRRSPRFRRLLVLPQTRLPLGPQRSRTTRQKGRAEDRGEPEYRSPKKTLKRLAQAHMFCELNGSELERDGPAKVATGKGTTSSRAANAAPSTTDLAAEAISGPWDNFSTRNLGLQVNLRMARDFGGDSQRMRHADVANVSRALKIDSSAGTWPSGRPWRIGLSTGTRCQVFPSGRQ